MYARDSLPLVWATDLKNARSFFCCQGTQCSSRAGRKAGTSTSRCVSRLITLSTGAGHIPRRVLPA